jgi:hypothetical protein
MSVLYYINHHAASICASSARLVQPEGGYETRLGGEFRATLNRNASDDPIMSLVFGSVPRDTELLQGLLGEGRALPGPPCGRVHAARRIDDPGPIHAGSSMMTLKARLSGYARQGDTHLRTEFGDGQDTVRHSAYPLLTQGNLILAGSIFRR